MHFPTLIDVIADSTLGLHVRLALVHKCVKNTTKSCCMKVFNIAILLLHTSRGSSRRLGRSCANSCMWPTPTAHRVHSVMIVKQLAHMHGMRMLTSPAQLKCQLSCNMLRKPKC